MQDKTIIVYTDGGASGNPGPGGYGVVMRLKNSNYEKTFSEGFRRTTNNRMELLAVIVALENIKKPGYRVIIYSDSKYVVEAIEKGWVFNWQRKGFVKKKNPDLWKRFLQIYPKHQVQFQWVKGHDGLEGNEKADRLAVAAYQKKPLQVDVFYEESEKSDTNLFT